MRGRETGICRGWGGSSNLYLKTGNVTKVFGHDGLVGTQAMYGVGYAFASKHPTIVVLGDAACEEDYVLGAMGFAGTHKVPVLFVIEDNDRSILTPKKVRRGWSVKQLANDFGILAWRCDGIELLAGSLCVPPISSILPILPILLEVPVVRERWHAGIGMDDGTPESYWPGFRARMFSRYGESVVAIESEAIAEADAAWV